MRRRNDNNKSYSSSMQINMIFGYFVVKLPMSTMTNIFRKRWDENQYVWA